MNPPEKKRGTHRRLCFPADEEAGVAYRIAQGDMAGLPIDRVSARLLRLVADARENKPSFEPTCENIVEAWVAASLRSAATARGMNIGRLKAGPTLHEVRREFVRLFVPNENWPKDWSRQAMNEFQCDLLHSRQGFAKTLKRLKLPVRRDSVGRPKNPQPK